MRGDEQKSRDPQKTQKETFVLEQEQRKSRKLKASPSKENEAF